MAPEVGLEPVGSINGDKGFVAGTHKYAHKFQAPLPDDLLEVVTAWPGLAAPLKAAIKAIIGSAGRREGAA